MPQQCRWCEFTSVSGLEQAAMHAIERAAKNAITQRGEFHLVLAGGTTPRRVYALLSKQRADWAAWHIYFGDERCLPVDHVERNSQMAAQAWLDHVAIPPAQIHIIPAETGAEQAATSYARVLEGIGLFDLVLLGLGEDGHTASLFPGRKLNGESAIAVQDAPKPPAQRVSLSAKRLSAARQVIFLVSGVGKRQAARDWRKGVDIPAAAIAPAGGVEIYVEEGVLGE